MRDPKTHAKVLALREDALWQARIRTLRTGDAQRSLRLGDLLGLIQGTHNDHRHLTKWEYVIWTTPPHWRHTTIIPDNEEK